MYGLIGHPVAHSASPLLHSLMGNEHYRLFDVKKGGLADFLRATPLKGFNLTMPHKVDILPLLDEVSDRVRLFGSCNTVVRRENGALFGDNTDAPGLAALLPPLDRFRRQKALVLGTGGAGRMAHRLLLEHGVNSVMVSRAGPNNYRSVGRHRDARLLINATPVGMGALFLQSPLPLAPFDRLEFVADMIYNPLETALLMDARRRRIPCAGGLRMLTVQAMEAARLWGFAPPPVQSLCRAVLERKRSIALIGMPGAGKTALGQALAQALNRPFTDMDGLFREVYGLTPAQAIKTQGERAFRRLESALLKETVQKQGLVIATGGGVVTEPGNLPVLRSNALVVHIRRPLHLLPSSQRPLSERYGVCALYRRRKDLYRAFRHRVMDNDGSLQLALERLLEVCHA